MGTPSLCYLSCPQFYLLSGLAPLSCCVVLMVNAFFPTSYSFTVVPLQGRTHTSPLFFSCSGICICQHGLVDVCFILCLQHHGIFSVPSLFLFVNSFPNTGKSNSHHLQNFYLFNPRAQNKGGSEVQTLGILLLFAAYEVFCPSKGYLFVSFTDKILFFYSFFLPKA